MTVMPTRWLVTDPGARAIVQFDAAIGGKLVNPLHKTSLVVQDQVGRDICRLVDPRSSVADAVFGLGPREWALTNANTLVAKLVPLPARKPRERPANLLRRLAQALEGGDRGLVSMGREHVLPAPAVLGMLALHDDITDVS